MKQSIDTSVNKNFYVKDKAGTTTNQGKGLDINRIVVRTRRSIKRRFKISEN